MVRIFSVFSVKLVSYDDDHVMRQCWVWALVTGQAQCCITWPSWHTIKPGHPAVNGHSLISLNFSAAERDRGKMSVTRNVRRQAAKNPRNQFLFWLWNSCDCIDDKQTDGSRVWRNARGNFMIYNSGFYGVKDWVVTGEAWPQSLIGQYWSRDLNTGLWLVSVTTRQLSTGFITSEQMCI